MPTTPEGKAIASRNAVTHGLFSQDVVLPHLGENADDYDALCADLARGLSPRTALQRHYVTQIAQSLWRLRRLLRWEQHLYDDPALTDEDRLTRMARVLRHDATLRRHIDRALAALGHQPQKRQNEPAPAPASVLPSSPWQGEVASLSEPEGVPRPSPVSASALRKARQLKLRQNCQNEPGIIAAVRSG